LTALLVHYLDPPLGPGPRLVPRLAQWTTHLSPKNKTPPLGFFRPLFCFFLLARFFYALTSGNKKARLLLVPVFTEPISLSYFRWWTGRQSFSLAGITFLTGFFRVCFLSHSVRPLEIRFRLLVLWLLFVLPKGEVGSAGLHHSSKN